MTTEPTDDRRPQQSPEEVFDDFVRRRECGESISLDEFCAAHPHLENALRGLASLRERPPETSDISEAELEISGALPALDLDLTCGERVGDYEIGAVLGRGGFGVVYRAHDRQLGRDVAFKVLKAGMDSAEILTRFEVERQTLALMNHVAIAKVYGAGATVRGRSYFVMEHVDGVPITTYATSHRLALRPMLQLFLQVVDGVQHAHQRGVLHRDLKPSNILVTESDEGLAQPKVIDFGLAKAFGTDLAHSMLRTEDGVIVGTPEYMSPEQATLTGHDVDVRTDVYSLGALLYELLTGVLPIPSETLRSAPPYRIPELIATLEPRRPSAVLGSAPDRGVVDALERRDRVREELDWIVMRAVEKDRAQRYDSAAALSDDLRRFLAEEPVLARPPSAFYKVRKFVRRRRRLVAAAAGIVVLLCSFVAFSWWQERARFHGLLRDGEKQLARYRALTMAYGTARSNWRAKQHRIEVVDKERWAPLWDRQDELAAWRAVEKIGVDLALTYEQVASPFYGALRLAPKGLDVDAEISETLSTFARVMEARLQREMPNLFRHPALAPSDFGPRAVTITASAPGFDVFCFRYEEHDGVLFPFPMDLATGKVVLETPVFVERVWPELASKEFPPPFQAGDRILEVAAKSIESWQELARSLRDVAVDRSVLVTFSRGSTKKNERWVPFARDSLLERRRRELVAQQKTVPAGPDPGRMTNSFLQSGVTFQAYPLQYRSENYLGTTEQALETSLDGGSYLLVFRRAERVIRLPLDVSPATGRLSVAVEIPEPSVLPHGFVYIPSGSITPGSDPIAYAPLESEATEVAGYWIARHELSLDEWQEFLNDVEVSERGPIPENGLWNKVRLFPSGSWSKRAGKWTFRKDHLGQWPAFGISYRAAILYTQWRTERDPIWRYRLPTAHEWERAARGADGRLFAWGDYFVWSSSLSGYGLIGRPQTVGTHPYDESPFGLRDVTGSVCEHTEDWSMPGTDFVAYRGGSFRIKDAFYFRLAGRNAQPASLVENSLGLRLVAEAK